MELTRAARIWRRVSRAAAAAAAGLIGAPRVLAQGCAMCYADAAAQSPRARHQLDLAILTLLVPSVLMFAGVLLAAFRRRERDLAYEEREKRAAGARRPASARAHTAPAPAAARAAEPG